MVPHCNLVGCGIRWLESVSESRTSEKLETKDEPVFFASCSCYFLFMSLSHFIFLEVSG